MTEIIRLGNFILFKKYCTQVELMIEDLKSATKHKRRKIFKL